ncbi:MAG: exported protein of unknown function [Acidimicrobiales bacterium]|nr:exported protein of unknown function [Acidimicrobiales bacterium]
MASSMDSTMNSTQDTTSGTESTIAISTPDTSTAISATADSFCAASFAIENPGQPNIDDSASPEAQGAALAEFFKNTLLPLGTTLQSVAPPSQQADIKTALDAISAAATAGDPSLADTQAVDDATNRIHDYSESTCGWKPVAFTTTEYKFMGIPTSLTTGIASFDLSNAGEQEHEMVLFRKNDDVTLDAKTLLALPQDQAQSMVTVIGSADAAPAHVDHLVANLAAGNYVYACFVPVGSTPGATPAADAPPHFMEGMYGEFSVG